MAMTESSPSETSADLGATIRDGGVHFAVWAPEATSVEVELHAEGGLTYHPLRAGADGLHEGLVPELTAGAHYTYRLDRDQSYPDPASRFQPEGVHGPSEVVDTLAFAWSDETWPGLSIDDLIVYELHVGAYTPQGTFAALIDQLPELSRLGVAAIELMPVAD